jgi:hypothetical protein
VSASPDRRRFVIGCCLGALAALALFGWMITAGTGQFLAREPLGNFYDAQATALMHGHWDMPRSVLGIDGFQVGSKYYMYFGIWPSLLRMPALLASDSLSGQLSRPSMFLAFAVLLGGAGALYWRIRTLFDPEGGCSRGEAAIAGVVVFTIGCGTTALFLASRAFVYHEAILWAAAWGLVAFERLIAFAQSPFRARLAVASLCTTLSILSRVSIGIGPVFALGVLGSIELVRMITDRRSKTEAPSGAARFTGALDRAGVQDASGRRWLLAMAIAAGVPLLAYAWMNVSRFGSPFGIPWGKQLIATLSAQHRAMLDANGGSLFGVKLIPTTLVQAVRPDALGFSPVFPWITFQKFATPIFGGAVFNEIDFTTSVAASMPALVVLGVLGVVAVIWTRLARSARLALLRAPLLGAAFGATIALAFTFIAARYLGDWIPLLTIAGLVGLEVLLRRRRSATHRARWTATIGLVAVLALFGIWVNFSLGLQYQRLYGTQDAAQQASMLAVQYRLSDDLGTGTPDVVRATHVPARPGSAGTVWIVRSCAALYWSSGRAWVPVEGTPPEGWVRVRANFANVGAAWSPVVAFGPAGRQDVVGVRRVTTGIQFALGQPDRAGALVWTPSFAVFRVSSGARTVEILADRVNHSLFAQMDGRYALTFSPAAGTQAPVRVARGPVSVGTATTGRVLPFPGFIRQLRPQIGSCEQILRRASP